MRKLSILHVGSFLGNIGDNANHQGFRPWFERLLNCPIDWQEFEIRNVYRKSAAFDSRFADAANEADLVVIGGGNYFEMWVESSPTGTSISIEDDVFSKIKTPILFNALGVDEGQGVTDTTLQKFRRFLVRLLGSDQYLVSVRNDGARATLDKYASGSPLDRVVALPDGGFFADYSSCRKAEGAARIGTKITVNLAGDMLERRFPGGALLDYQGFLSEFADVLRRTDEAISGLRIVLVPHVFADVRVYADLLARLPDRLRREQVRVAAYDNGPAAAYAAFSEYLDANVVVAMRFHANVVPIANGVPTIGLSCYDQIPHLYRELELERHAINVRSPGYGALLADRIQYMTTGQAEIKAELAGVMAAIKAMRNTAEAAIGPWLDRHGLRRSCT